MVDDVDWALRHLGVGDLRVDCKAKNTASTAQVRVMTCEAGYEGGDEALSGALSDNFYLMPDL